ncbi:MAG: hypothetical protein QNJ73_05305 [Gammaproteobacteria bacterium]|nr:hypothetical protein [Gammaproteobacteria bacterium]
MECILRWLDEVDSGYFGLRMVWSRYQRRFLTIMLAIALALATLFVLPLR